MSSLRESRNESTSVCSALESKRSFYPGGKPTKKDMQARHATMHTVTDYLLLCVPSIPLNSFDVFRLSLFSPLTQLTFHPSSFLPPPSPPVQPFLFSACTVWCNEFAQVAWLESKSRSSLETRARARGGGRIKRPMVNSASRATRKNRPRNMNKFLVRELRRVRSNERFSRVRGETNEPTVNRSFPP